MARPRPSAGRAAYDPRPEASSLLRPAADVPGPRAPGLAGAGAAPPPHGRPVRTRLPVGEGLLEESMGHAICQGIKAYTLPSPSSRRSRGEGGPSRSEGSGGAFGRRALSCAHPTRPGFARPPSPLRGRERAPFARRATLFSLLAAKLRGGWPRPEGRGRVGPSDVELCPAPTPPHPAGLRPSTLPSAREGEGTGALRWIDRTSGARRQLRSSISLAIAARSSSRPRASRLEVASTTGKAAGRRTRAAAVCAIRSSRSGGLSWSSLVSTIW